MEATSYSIIEAEAGWAPQYKAFCRRAYIAAYVRPEMGITEELYSEERFNSPRIIKYYQELLEKSDTNRSWLALDQNNEIIGGTGAHRYPDYGEMKGFYVAPELQGQGIGHSLYQKVLDFVEDLPLQVDVVEYMKETIEMYEHWGFKRDVSKGYIVYPWPDWPDLAREKTKGVYMVKPASK